MCYGFYPGPIWFSPGESYGWPNYSIFGGWHPPYPHYGGRGQTSLCPPRGSWQQMPFPMGGWMPPFGFPMTKEGEIDFLRNRADMLKEELDQIDNRIGELESAGR